MNQPNIEPVKKNGGSAFRGNRRLGFHPVPHMPDRTPTHVVSLAEFCRDNFISRDQGYRAIELKYLIGFKKYGKWWVRSNPDCYEELLEYLGIEELLLDGSGG